MKNFLYTILFCSILLPGLAQNNLIETWESKLNTSKPDTQKVNLLEKLAWEWKNQDLQKADQYADQAIELANQLNYTLGQAKSHKTKGVIFWYRGNINQAIKNFNISLEQFKAIEDRQGEANIYNNLGLAYQMTGDYGKSVDFLKEAYEIRKEIKDLEGMGTSCNNLGVIYQMLGAYDYSLNNHLRALEIYTTLNEDENIARSLMNVGNVYATLEEHEKAFVHFSQSLDILENISDKRGMADAYSNLGQSYFMIDSIVAAQKNFEEALRLREELDDQTGIQESLTDLGRIYSKREDLENALAFHRQGLQVAQKIEDQPATVRASLFLGETLLEKSSWTEAEGVLENAFALAKVIDSNPELSNAHKLLAQLAQQQGQTDKALKHQIAYSEIKDAMFDEEKAQALRRMQVVYETSKQKVQIADLQEDVSESEFEKYSLLVVMVSLILGAMSWFFYYKYRSESRTAKMLYSKNREIEFQNNQLAISNADLEQFAYVVSHDLKQPLRTIGSFSGLIERRYKDLVDHDGKEYLKFILGGVKHMEQLLTDLLTYSRLGRDAERTTVDLNEVLTRSIQSLKTEIQESNAIINMDNLPHIKGIRSSQVLLFQNLISNALKFRGNKRPVIDVYYQDSGDSHLISISDNGIGMQKEYISKIFTVFQKLHGPEEYEGTGIGLAICQKVVRQQNGNLWVESTPGEGSTFYVKFPKEEIQDEQAYLKEELVLPVS